MFNNNTLPYRGMWIGMEWKGNQRGWEWDDKSPLKYTNWDNGEPNDYGGVAEDCVELHERKGETENRNISKNNFHEFNRPKKCWYILV